MLKLRKIAKLIIYKTSFVFLFILILIFNPTPCSSQVSNQRDFSYFEFKAGLGTTHYFGDIGGANTRKQIFKRFEDFDLFETRFAFMGGLRYQINNSFAFSLNLIPGLIAGDDKYSLNRNRDYKFQSIIVDAAGQFEYYLLPWTAKIRPYIFGGLDATAWVSNNVFELEEDRQIKLRNTWARHAGLGFIKEINADSNYGVNIGFHHSFSDFIDGYNGGTDVTDMYYYILFEYSTKIAKRSIYNRKGKIRRPGILNRSGKKYSETNIKRFMAEDPNELRKQDRRAIKRYLQKIERKRKRNLKRNKK